MKNPNGYGSIIKLGGKRRKPFAARVTAGWEINKKTRKEKQLYNYIGYYKTRPEAMIALAEYNKSPYDVDAKKITFEQVYELYLKEKFPQVVTEQEKKRKNLYDLAFGYSKNLHKIKFADIRKVHMQEVINECDLGHGSLKNIKTLFNQMYKLASERDWIEKNYAEFVTLPSKPKKTTRKPFNEKEIKELWTNVENNEFIEVILIMIYTGMRPGELLQIENENIHIEERYMIGGSKTEAGIDRVIPIHKRIKPFLKKRMSDRKYLITNSLGRKMAYDTFRAENWVPAMVKLKMEHKPHDARHAFATMMDNVGANKLSIKKIMGHATSDITDGVYTHKSVEELLKAIDMLE